jgi:hypothetical protein
MALLCFRPLFDGPVITILQQKIRRVILCFYVRTTFESIIELLNQDANELFLQEK